MVLKQKQEQGKNKKIDWPNKLTDQTKKETAI